jgi:hypothetical protein
MNACKTLVLAIDEVTATARNTVATISGEKPDTDPLPDFPTLHSLA